jgi:hypothetical protein
MKYILFLIIYILLITNCFAEKITNVQLDGSDSSIVGLWHLNTGSGSNAYDVSGNNNTGSITGSLWATGLLEQCLDYNGSGDKITITDSSSLKPDNNFSICVWFNTISPGDQGIFQSWSQNPALAGIRLWLLSSEFRFDLGRNTGTTQGVDWEFITSSSSGFIDGKWHLVCAVYDGSKMYIYVDGDEKTSTSWTGDPGYASPNYVRIGILNNDGTELDSLSFDGKLEEVSLHNRALTGAEIKYLYSRQARSYQ